MLPRSIMMSPQQHLDGLHAIFGDIVDGHDVALRVNQLATPGKDLMYSPDAVVRACVCAGAWGITAKALGVDRAVCMRSSLCG